MDKSGLKLPFVTVIVRLAAPKAIGALIVEVAVLAIVEIFPASVIVPVPVIDDPVMLIDPTVVTLLLPKAKTPELTVNALVIEIEEASVTTLLPDPPVFEIVRLATV